MGKAISIVAFIISLLFFVPFAPVIGLVLGIIALVKSKKDPTISKGFSIAAIVLGTLFGLINLIVSLGFFIGFFKGLFL